jgi:hypothetical protein
MKQSYGEVKQMVYDLYNRLRKQHFIPGTLVLLGRQSLLPGATLVDLLQPKHVRYADNTGGLTYLGKNRNLIFTLCFHGAELKELRQAIHGYVFRTCCLYKSCIDEPDFYVHVIPPDMQLTMPTRLT